MWTAKSVRYICTAVIQTPLGDMLAGATGDTICLLEFDDRSRLERQSQTARKLFRMPLLPGEHPLLARLKRQLDEYFEGKRMSFDIPLAYPGTDFQRRVWKALIAIPYGQTRSYGEVARTIGKPGAVRAVGGANGSNRIAIIIPCHRVIAAGGGPGGYGGGLWRKRKLLELERSREY
ncbi:MAG: methylated-DNA--[protein]-cysteine S-methyltransferase [Chloroflexi bacterium]|nr:methylated-DNA--[protein]-cysteine S-methyltransferase [Chloroflexota bacterium]